ncbi:WYL domain-containing protein [Helicobacter sp. MIT 21-1697]|uniref:helix-turn-helix transcriptional regulator n=1 Tax=Helicobacter sp. MIT 21-1697 TaxID=2993733 RepID=UPI00224B5173|nr:WYL domain-containing protein [Helicobacter sp. MIT 21-1697]MCX2716954.1 WYL domain-containing protein [Helicobacter sp. MIT 21-1697]
MKIKHYDVLSHRIATILKLLAESESIEVAKLCAEFNVSEKTIGRDIKRINDPNITLKKGKITMQHTQTPYNTQEQIALFVLQNIAKDLGGEVGRNAAALLDKLNTPKPESAHNVFFTKTLLDDISVSAQELHTLQHCITHKQMISCLFHHKSRILAPLKIVAFDGEWYLFALEYTDKKAQKSKKADELGLLKRFYLNDINAIESLQTPFNADDNMLDSIDGAINAWFHPDNEKIFVRLWVDKKVAKYFKRKKITSKAQVFVQNDGSVMIELHITHFLEISGEVLRWIPYVVVLEPKALRESIRQSVKEYIKKLDSIE